MSDCACNSKPESTELDQAVAEVIRASAESFDTKIADLIARIDKIERVDGVGKTSEDVPEGEAVTAAPEDVADSRVRELENRVGMLEESLSALIVESTPDMEQMQS